MFVFHLLQWSNDHSPVVQFVFIFSFKSFIDWMFLFGQLFQFNFFDCISFEILFIFVFLVDYNINWCFELFSSDDGSDEMIAMIEYSSYFIFVFDCFNCFCFLSSKNKFHVCFLFLFYSTKKDERKKKTKTKNSKLQTFIFLFHLFAS